MSIRRFSPGVIDVSPKRAKWQGTTVALDRLPLLGPSHPVWGQPGTHQFFLFYDNTEHGFSIK